MAEQIPEKYLEFCKAVGRLCREAGLQDFAGSFNPRSFLSKGEDWHFRIEFSWGQGRHGALNQRIYVKSTQDISCDITVADPTEGE